VSTPRPWSVKQIQTLGVTTGIVPAGTVLGICRTNAYRLARTNQFLVQDEPRRLLQDGDVLLVRGSAYSSRHGPKRSDVVPATTQADRLDPFTVARMDRQTHPAHPAHADCGDGSATDPRPYPGRGVERKPDPCPPHSHATPADERPDTADDHWPPNPGRPHPQASSSDTAGPR
jgi:hypothetical protein